jgi:hypothetical protein
MPQPTADLDIDDDQLLAEILAEHGVREYYARTVVFNARTDPIGPSAEQVVIKQIKAHRKCSTEQAVHLLRNRAHIRETDGVRHPLDTPTENAS